MPELPEVETVARQLAPMITGQRLRGLAILDRARLPVPGRRRLVGRRITRVFRSGKQIVLGLRDRRGVLYLAVHLRMTGRLLYRPDPGRDERQHLRARFELEHGRLLFYDPRRFGTLTIRDSEEQLRPVGVEPLSDALTAARLGELLGDSRQPLKPWLLRQDRLVGLGNIYASEILHAARLHPLRPAGSLRREEVRRLHRALRGILRRAIECCGTTFSDFQDARGLQGSFQHLLAVYGREGERCRRCGGRIARMVQQQRTSFYCPECQVLDLVD